MGIIKSVLIKVLIKDFLKILYTIRILQSCFIFLSVPAICSFLSKNFYDALTHKALIRF